MRFRGLEIKNMRELSINEVTGDIELPTSIYGNRSITLETFLKWCTENGIPSNTKLSELEDLLIAELRLLPNFETLKDYSTLEDTAEMIAQAQLVGEEVDLSIYARKSVVEDQLLGKVDKVQGKGLSEADYTELEKTKLAGVEDNAQVNPPQSFYDNLTSPLINRIAVVENTLPNKVDTQTFNTTVANQNSAISERLKTTDAEQTYAKKEDLTPLVKTIDFDLYKIQQTQTLADKADKSQITPLATKQYVDDKISLIPTPENPVITLNGEVRNFGDFKFLTMTILTNISQDAIATVDFAFAGFTQPPHIQISPISSNPYTDRSANNATWTCLMNESVTNTSCVLRTKSADSAGLLAAMVSVNKACQVNIFAIGV